MPQKAALKISISLAIFFFALAMAGNALSGQRARVLTVTAVVQDERVSTGSPYVDEGTVTRRSHFPDHPELYAPMPLPESTEPKSLSEPENKWISYNMITGKETIHDSLPAYLDMPISGQVMGGMGAGIIGPKKIRPEGTEEEYGPVPLNFSELSLVSNPEEYPWCANVKLYIKFASGWYVASGALIDSMHVIVAGHCVYDALNGGDWATSIVVVPAYEHSVRPYGDASAVQLYSWTGWTKYADWDYDIGVIDLDRPIGALTGWYGYGYNNNPDFYTNNTFYSAGYPAESPYSGEYMYQWHGTFDYTHGNEVGFYQQSYGGQSGSGAYYSGNKCIYAVLHTGVNQPGGPTNDVRITSTEFEDIRDSFIAEDTPSTFDLIPLEVTISPSTITAGEQLSSMSYLVHNYSSVSWSGRVNVKVYLSNNDNISPADTLIQSGYFTASFDPKSSVVVNVPTPPTIPKDVVAGNHWIGVILDISDNNTANNDSDGQDASPIHVLCSAPVTPSNANPSDGATGVSINTDLDWSDCANADSYDIYFGTSSNPPKIGTVSSSYYNLPTLNYNTHYYWKIVAKNNCGNSTPGPVWEFTTASCTYSISSTSKHFDSSGGTGSVTVSAGSGCRWTATSNRAWIHITSGSSGTGSGTVNYSVDANSNTSSRTGTMTIAGKTFTVTQEGVYTYTLNVHVNPAGSGRVTTGDGIDCPGTCSKTYNQGTTVTLTAKENSGYKFDHWAGCDSTNANQGTVTMNANRDVTAYFKTTGSLSVTPSTGLASSGYQGGPFSPSSKTYTLQNTGGDSINWKASKGASWVTLSKTSGMLAAGARTTVKVSINSSANSLGRGTHSDTVTFTNMTNGRGNTTRSVTLNIATQYTLSVTVNGHGSVSSSPSGINCGSDCSETYSAGTAVTLTATPESGYTFTGWGGDCSSCGSNTNCRVTMDSNRSCSATFNQPPQPPVIDSFTAHPTSGEPPLTVTFFCQAHDPDGTGTIVSYKWDFDGDGVVDEISDTGTIDHIYRISGTYNATCTAVDDDDASVTSGPVTIKVGFLPGDCNGDGTVSIDEIQKSINCYLSLENVCCDKCDLNSDGTVSINEVQRVINAYLGK